MRASLRICALIAGIIILYGCNANNCPLESTVYCNYYFYDSDGTAISYNDVLTISVRIPSTERDSIIINKLSGASQMQIPMSYYNDKDTLFIGYASLLRKDTIIVHHQSYAHIDLPECGTKYFHKLENVTSTHTGIDRIEIVNPQVNYDGNENIKIYFNGVAE
ncbi:MAG: DUF6452 family protein [Bacteroidaceae bacterium]|nr:DUF6452 family protein [Bacteroidaceae bacterium]